MFTLENINPRGQDLKVSLLCMCMSHDCAVVISGHCSLSGRRGPGPGDYDPSGASKVYPLKYKSDIN